MFAHTRGLRRVKATGMTLVELMVTLSIAAIVLTFGVSGFQSMIAHNKMANAANSLIGHLQLARSEAVKRSTSVTVCPSSDGMNCLSATPSVWSNGYLVATLDSAGNIGQVLRRVEGSEMRAIRADSGGRALFIFRRDGTATGTNGTVKICDPNDSSRIRQVVVNPVGRAYVMCNDPGAYTCPDSCP